MQYSLKKINFLHYDVSGRLLQQLPCVVINHRTCSLLYSLQRCQSSSIGGWNSAEASDFVVLGRLLKSGLLHVGCKRWHLRCSSSLSSDVLDEVAPESLWEVNFGYFANMHQQK